MGHVRNRGEDLGATSPAAAELPKAGAAGTLRDERSNLSGLWEGQSHARAVFPGTRIPEGVSAVPVADREPVETGRRSRVRAKGSPALRSHCRCVSASGGELAGPQISEFGGSGHCPGVPDRPDDDGRTARRERHQPTRAKSHPADVAELRTAAETGDRAPCAGVDARRWNSRVARHQPCRWTIRNLA